jgi:hypothetical protein
MHAHWIVREERDPTTVPLQVLELLILAHIRSCSMRAPLICAVLLSVHSTHGLLAAPAVCRTSTLSLSRLSFAPRGSSASAGGSRCSAAAATRALATTRMDATESISSYLNIPEERILKVSLACLHYFW